ncbi:hypothetical protein FACS1894137_12520 [Spirochaetia bacterium]|nr:hypothetical protein FACS1894137_12520 [Spirochaetia bacterium]
MKNIKLILMGMLAILLTFGMGLSGCSSDSDDSGADGGYAGEEARHEQELADFGYTIIERQTVVPWDGEWYEYVGPDVFKAPTAGDVGYLTLSYRGRSASIYITSGESTKTAQRVADLINNKLLLIPEDYRPELKAFVRNEKAGTDKEYLVISTPESSTDPFTISSATKELLQDLFNNGQTWTLPVVGVIADENPYGKGIGNGTVYYLYTAAREPQYDTWDFTVRAYPYSTVGTRLLVDTLNIGDYDDNGEYDGIPIASGSSKEEVARALADAYNQWIIDNDYTGLITVTGLSSSVVTVQTKTNDEIPWPGIEGYDGFNAFGYHVFAAHSQESVSLGSDLGSAQETINTQDIVTVLPSGRLTIGYQDDVYDTILFDSTVTLTDIQNLLVNTRVQVEVDVTDTTPNYPGSDTKKRLHFFKYIDDDGRELASLGGTAKRNGDDISVTLNDTEEWQKSWNYPPDTSAPYTNDYWTIYVFGAPTQGDDARYHHTIASSVRITGLKTADPDFAEVEGGKAIGSAGTPNSVQEQIMAWINGPIPVGGQSYAVSEGSNKVAYTGAGGNGASPITTQGNTDGEQFGNGAHILLTATNSAPGISDIQVQVSNN